MSEEGTALSTTEEVWPEAWAEMTPLEQLGWLIDHSGLELRFGSSPSAAEPEALPEQWAVRKANGSWWTRWINRSPEDMVRDTSLLGSDPYAVEVLRLLTGARLDIRANDAALTKSHAEVERLEKTRANCCEKCGSKRDDHYGCACDAREEIDKLEARLAKVEEQRDTLREALQALTSCGICGEETCSHPTPFDVALMAQKEAETRVRAFEVAWADMRAVVADDGDVREALARLYPIAGAVEAAPTPPQGGPEGEPALDEKVCRNCGHRTYDESEQCARCGSAMVCAACREEECSCPDHPAAQGETTGEESELACCDGGTQDNPCGCNGARLPPVPTPARPTTDKPKRKRRGSAALTALAKQRAEIPIRGRRPTTDKESGDG